MANVARDLLWPTDPEILVRVVFLYVGQGSSTLLLCADGDTYQTLLLDINLDEKRGGIDVPRLMEDLLDGDSLDVFVNSHPHNDHLYGLDKLRESVTIEAIWHSGHVPSEDHDEVYALLVDALTEVEDAGGEIEELDSSRTAKVIGEVECYVLAPAEHVQDAIEDETPKVRDERIHEYCAVLRVGAGDTWVMLPGDADRDAWENHITDYWEEEGKVQAAVLAAPHHGSRSFFKHDESDESYLLALEAIAPEYVVISAPAQEESLHGHPHDDAVELYADQVDEDNILHTGAAKHSFICDIFRDGTHQILPDDGQLTDAYGLTGETGDDSDGGGEKMRRASSVPAFTRTRVDDRPMGGR
ncbi:MAG: competence protein ComEC [Chloroflexota bacterium]|nr:competence protein ComEC [Chloroflexota bacterium]